MGLEPAVSKSTAGAPGVADAAEAPVVLSYATGQTAPTRVRFNTAELVGRWAFWIRLAGLVALDVEFCVLLHWIVTECFADGGDLILSFFGLRRFYSWEWYFGGGPRDFAVVLREYAAIHWPYIAGGLVFLADGILLRWLAVMVRRGSQVAAVLALVMLGPIAATFMGLTIWSFVAAVYFTLTAGTDGFLLLLLPVAVGALLLTLMVGAFRQLAWVARNPDLERPPLTFWPRRRRAGA